MDSLLKSIQGLSVQTDFYGLCVSVSVSFVASVFIAILYYNFFENRRRGAQAHRFFLVGGPAITVMLLAIQFSLPLSLGLLGALSIIRFRTPVKEPEEVAYIMLLIAISITCATFNFQLSAIMLFVATFALFVQRYVPLAFVRSRKPALLLLTFSGEREADFGGEVEGTVGSLLPEGKFEHVSASDGFSSYHYSFDTKEVQDTHRIIAELKKKLSPDKINIVFHE